MVTIKDTTLIKSFNEGDPMAFTPTILSARLTLLTILCRTFSWPYGTDGKNLIVSKKSVLFFLSPHVTLALIMPNMNK